MDTRSVNNAPRILHGHDGPVEIDEIARTVTKTYLFPGHDTAVRMAQREIEFASRFHVALSARSDIACPAVVDWDLSPPPRVVMAFSRGEVLAELLANVRRGDPRGTAIAGRIHDGLEIYARLFGEPYHDLCFQNLIYDDTAHVLTFLDFGVPNRADGRGLLAPLAASLGNLLGSACYSMVRPARMLTPTDGYRHVLRAVMLAFEGRVAKQQVLEFSLAAFRRITECGAPARQGYYRTIGAITAHRYMKQVLG